MKLDRWGAFILGVNLGVWLVIAGSFISGDRAIVQKAHISQKQCEARLPRDQHCVMAYMPEFLMKEPADGK
jgi:hypothetical protein